VIIKQDFIYPESDGRCFVLVNECCDLKKMAATSQVLGLCLSSAVLLLLAPETVSALPPVIRVGKSIYPNNKFSSLYFSFTRDPERFKFLYSALNFVMAMETTFQSQIYHCVSFALKFNHSSG
jgi:hypothetical protein